MLKLSNITIQFENKTVFDHAEFEATAGVLTVIKGKSGIGKSIFLDTFIFKHPCNYIYEDQDISSYTDEDKQKFILDHISFIHQLPLFIYSMTIEEHINMYINMGKERNMEIEDKLGISQLLKKYPKSLSGGERTRAAVYLGTLKDSPILILDEPTASLDYKNSIYVIEILKEYAAKGHYVIVASHDHKMINAADVLYEVKDHKLITLSKLSQSPVTQKTETTINKLKIKFGHRTFKALMMLLVSCTMILSIYGFHLYDSMTSSYSDILNDSGSLNLLVYKTKYDQDYYSYEGREYPFTDKEIDKLKQVDHIDDMYWLYDYDAVNRTVYDQYIDIKNMDEDPYTISLYEDNKELIKAQTISHFSYHSYSGDYSDELELDFHQDGIILTYDLYQEIIGSQNISADQPLYLEYILFVPVYDASGIAGMMIDENSNEVKVNQVDCAAVKVKMPVAGVLKKYEYMYSYKSDNMYIYVPDDLLNEYIVKYQQTSARTAYYVANEKYEGISYDKLPDGAKDEDVVQTVVESPWKPDCYVLKVDSLENVESAIDEIKSYGFSVENEYVDSNAYTLLNKSNKTIFMLFVVLVLLIILSFYVYLKYLIQKDDQNVKKYLDNIGIDKTTIKNIYYKKYIRDTILLAILSVLLYRGSIELVCKIYIVSLIMAPKMIFIVYLLAVSLLVEGLIPAIMYHKLNKS